MARQQIKEAVNVQPVSSVQKERQTKLVELRTLRVIAEIVAGITFLSLKRTFVQHAAPLDPRFVLVTMRLVLGIHTLKLKLVIKRKYASHPTTAQEVERLVAEKKLNVQRENLEPRKSSLAQSAVETVHPVSSAAWDRIKTMRIDVAESRRIQQHFFAHLEARHAKLSLLTSTHFAAPCRIQTALPIKLLLAPTISATTKATVPLVSRVKMVNL